MIFFRPDIPPHVAETVRRLPPEIKKSVRGALTDLSENPDLGEPLLRDLKGLWKYKVRRYRIVYEPDRAKRILRIYAVNHRREVYDRVKKERLP